MKVFLTILGLICLLGVTSEVGAVANSGSISASPNPCVIGSNCDQVTISWSVQGVEYEAYVARGSTRLWTGSQGSQQVSINTNGNDNTFTLYADAESWSTTASAATPTPAPTAVPSVPDYRTCNQPCGSSNAQCISGLTCVNGQCRLPSNPNDSSCTPPSANTTSSSSSAPTPTKTPAPSQGGTTAVLGTSQTASPTLSPEILGAEATKSSESSDAATNSMPTPTPGKSFLEDLVSSPGKALLTVVNGVLATFVVILILQLLGVVNIGFLSNLLKKFTR